MVMTIGPNGQWPGFEYLMKANFDGAVFIDLEASGIDVICEGTMEDKLMMVR